MRMVAWMGGRKSPYTPSIRPYTSEYTAVYSKYTARILLQYFEYTAQYLKKCRLPHIGVGVWNWLSGFLTPPPYFQGAKLIFFVSHGHTERLGTCAKMAVLGGYSCYARLCSP